jgi:hypothetical protein
VGVQYDALQWIPPPGFLLGVDLLKVIANLKCLNSKNLLSFIKLITHPRHLKQMQNGKTGKAFLERCLFDPEKDITSLVCVTL